MDFFNSPNFNRHVETLMQKNRVPGLSIAIIQGDQLKSAGFGFASIEAQTPCTADTLFDIASLSKSLTAAAIALLVDDKTHNVQYDSIMSDLLLDDFVMSNDVHTKTVTVDDLLGHHTGMPGHDDSYMGARAAEPDNTKSITRNLRNLAIAAPPRSRYIYCNMMYTVLTHLIEVKAKQEFGDFLQRRVFDPLDMTSSSLQPESAKAKGHDHRLAKGHIWDKKSSSYREFEAVDSPEGQGAGSVISSANDFIKFLKALINREGPISDNVYKGLTEPRSSRGPNKSQRKANIERIFYTAGMDLYFQRNHGVFGHSGDITGFGSRFVFLPDFKFGAVVMGNSSGVNSVAAQLFRELTDHVISSQPEMQLPGTRVDEREILKKIERRQPPENRSRDGPLENISDTMKDQKGNDKKLNEENTNDGKPLSLPLDAYTGNYWNPGYRNMKVGIKDDELFIDARDRSLGFTARLKRKQNQTTYDAHVLDAFETGGEILTTEFIIENGAVIRMGMDLEPLINDLIWFDKVENEQ
ncbi:hypothetical protein F53441_11734 [Fusarium austroafricanum]|uniref:Beta-lactamase-related domain-containing protein n=1 Tax=Fusarium austroafricanum TaxID=2364996 RepID=A0A8H4K469_9HYPO|nr:hypothetical protein F53441_11734 [Fusarium austroafricanum]